MNERVDTFRADPGAAGPGPVLAATPAAGPRTGVARPADSPRIGLLCSPRRPGFLSSLLVGALDACGAGGAELIVTELRDPDAWGDAIGALAADGVDAVLLTPPLCDSQSLLGLLDALQMPAVAVATASPNKAASAVYIDDYAGALAMTRHLLSLGHTDIAFIQGDPELSPALARYRAFCDAMAEAGLAPRPGRVVQGRSSYRCGLAGARQLLEQESRPSAIFTCNDEMAAAVVAVAHGLGLEVPGDLAVCGFDDTPLAITVWPSLSTVHLPIEEMARVAVELACAQIRRRQLRQPFVAEHRLLPWALVPRLSSGAAQ